jgi:hypothetical protein
MVGEGVRDREGGGGGGRLRARKGVQAKLQRFSFYAPPGFLLGLVRLPDIGFCIFWGFRW